VIDGRLRRSTLVAQSAATHSRVGSWSLFIDVDGSLAALLSTGGLLVRIQPEEPFVSLTYSDGKNALRRACRFDPQETGVILSVKNPVKKPEG
jgi:hypothetical protein